MMRKFIFLLVLLSLVAACTNPNGPAPNTKKKYTIAVIPKGTTHEFWKSIHAGSIKAANELTGQGTLTEVIWKGPLREDDREQQIQVVEGFAAQGVDGIVLAPLDNRALVRPVSDAGRAGVPVPDDERLGLIGDAEAGAGGGIAARRGQDLAHTGH